MQISGITDKISTEGLSSAKAQPKDFSENLQKAMDNPQTARSAAQPDALQSGSHFVLFTESMQTSSYLANTRELQSLIQAEKPTEAQSAQKAETQKAEEIGAAVQNAKASEEVNAEDMANEGAGLTEGGEQGAENDGGESEGNEETAQENVAAVQNEDTSAGQNTPAVNTAASTETAAKASSDVPNSLDELPAINIVPASGTSNVYAAPRTETAGTGGTSYEELKQLLLVFCMMMMSGSSGESNEMQGVIMVALMSYIGNLDALRTDVVNTGSAQGIEEWALDRMEREIFNNTEDYPSRRSRACNPLITSDATNRSAALYNQVVKQFDVENRDRYQNTSSSTWCNIYLWDVTSAMGAEIPHYIDPNTSAPRTYPDVSGAKELNANATHDWLKKYGPTYGWMEVDAETAQRYANSGRPAVTAWKNPNSGRSGHVQIVVPSSDGQYNAERGVAVSQAGSRLREYTYITEIYGGNALKNVSYFVHA